MEKTEQVLQDRGQAYGDFTHFSDLVHSLEQTCIRHMQTYNPQALAKMQPFMIEGLHMVLHKISRVVNGDPLVEDSWRDIGGYATLVADRVGMVNILINNADGNGPQPEVPVEAPLATGDMGVPVGGVHPHEEEPRTDHVDSPEDHARVEFATRY